MAYLKPPAVVSKVFNPLAMRFGLGGTKTLTVARRRSGTPQRVPVVPVEHDGATYVVSTRGESDWVRNVRAAGRLELDGRSYGAEEVPAADRGPILDAYRAKAGKTVDAYWKKLPEPVDHPAFRLGVPAPIA